MTKQARLREIKETNCIPFMPSSVADWLITELEKAWRVNAVAREAMNCRDGVFRASTSDWAAPRKYIECGECDICEALTQIEAIEKGMK